MKSFAKSFAALIACAALAFGMVACSNASDSGSSSGNVNSSGSGNGSGNGNGSGGGGTQTPAPISGTYTITFNANDGSEEPATATQIFNVGTPQNLKTIAELGFKKDGYKFVGWGDKDGKYSLFPDGMNYLAWNNETLYAHWAEYGINIVLLNEVWGTLEASPAAASAGTEITLSNKPADGYQFVSYSVVDADGKDVSITDGKFTMPACDVTVSAFFKEIEYSVTVKTDGNGSITADPTSATSDTPVYLSLSPKTGYLPDKVTVTGKDGVPVDVFDDGTRYNWIFRMPAKNVTVAAKFVAQNFTAQNFTVTFYPYDYSENPATATQTFTAGIPQNLKTIEELGFKRDGYKFDYWYGYDGDEYVEYEDGASYTANADTILYAHWSEAVYSVNIDQDVKGGTIEASRAAAKAGTVISLYITEKTGYNFASCTVTADDGTNIDVDVDDDGIAKFTMPTQDVTVSAKFDAIDYEVSVAENITGGSVAATPTIAHFGDTIVLVPTADIGWQLSAWDVIAGGIFKVNVTGNKFEMLPQHVSVNAKFTKIDYSITIDATNGSVTADKETANYGDKVTLTITPDPGYKLSVVAVTPSGEESFFAHGDDVSRTFTMPANNVTVKATFEAVPTASGAYTPLAKGTDGSVGTSGTYVTFGLWPQTIKTDNVTVDESCESKTVGEFTYYKGNDNQWYAKVSDKYYKVEPIKWRVLATEYNGKIKNLLLAESVLIGRCYGENKTIYQNSEIRKWLNSNENTDAVSDHNSSGGFFKTAFTGSEQSKIVALSIDNSVRSTYPDSDSSYHENIYASDIPTTDKVFLLSCREVTKSDYGFADSDVKDKNRIRQATDYAKAIGEPYRISGGKYVSWLLRSPKVIYNSNAGYFTRSIVGEEGYVSGSGYNPSFGVVPALYVGN